MRSSRLFFLSVLTLPFLLPGTNSCERANGRNEAQNVLRTGSGPSLRKTVEDLAKDPSLKKGRLAFYAIELSSGYQLASHHPRELIIPASAQKLVTTIAASRILGTEHRFKTILGYTGSIDNGQLQGDLLIKGGGDPAFLSEEFPDHYGSREELFNRWAQACRQAGIERVNGRLLVDAGHFPYNTLSRGRIWEDMGNYFGAFPSGMNYSDNSFTLLFHTPERAGAPTEILSMSPDIPWLEIENRVTSSKVQEDRAYIYGKPYDEERIVEGTLPAGRSSFEIEGSIPDPARVTAWKLHQSFENKGISISGSPSTLRLEGIDDKELTNGLDTVRSPDVAAIVEKTNFHSKNLFAETLLLEMGKELGTQAKPRPSGKALLQRIEEWGIDTEGIRLEDGSGLAPTNRVTAAFLVKILEKAWKGPHRDIIRNSLPIAGESGSMRYVGNGTAASGRIWAKSGYMSGVRAYAGYAKDRNGKMRAFALIANDFTCSASAMREKMENVLVSLVEQDR